MVKTKTDLKLQPIDELVRSYKDWIYTYANIFKLSFGRFLQGFLKP